MNLKIMTMAKTEKGTKKMPVQFDEPVRVDLIRRAVESVLCNMRQAYGADPMAGKRQAAKISRRRRDYKGAYGQGISRVPRKIMSRNGTQMNWQGAFAPGTKGGRRAHPAKAERTLSKGINIKERRKAIRSALAATLDKDVVTLRGHKIPASYPFIIDADFENLYKTVKVIEALTTLELGADLERAGIRNIRAGKGKNRGRPYKGRKGPLIVVSKSCPLAKAASNIPGVDVVEVSRLNAALLAPGTHAGRLTLYTEAAIERMDKEGLFR